MAPNTKRVFYVNNVSAPVYLDILARRPDIQVDKLQSTIPRTRWRSRCWHRRMRIRSAAAGRSWR